MIIPVTVVTGFLGAGKSTLVEGWLSALPRDETAVIVNERGDVGIDGELLASHVSRLREITAGCVCCETQAELASALVELSGLSPAPRRILVETSGAASPAGVIRALTRGKARERLRLDGVITVIDASRVERALSFDLAVEQLGFADVVVMSHADRADEAALDATEARLVRHAPGAVMVRAGRDRTVPSLDALLEQREEVLRILPEAAGAHAAIDAVSLVVDGPLDEERFADWVEEALGAVEARVLRVKGILAMEGLDARVIVQGVGEAIEVTIGAPWGDTAPTSRLVILGLGLEHEALEAGFAACAALPDPNDAG
ncbi:MAG: GTP-binding protein [Sandaracinaceae bacterium]